MKFVTVKQLQREFGLPFTVAERIVQEQMALARQRYRRWNTPIYVGLAASIACTFAPDGSLAYRIGHVLLPLCMGATGILLGLVRRRAQAPILAAARATAPG